jgi:hypothetical protein
MQWPWTSSHFLSTPVCLSIPNPAIYNQLNGNISFNKNYKPFFLHNQKFVAQVKVIQAITCASILYTHACTHVCTISRHLKYSEPTCKSDCTFGSMRDAACRSTRKPTLELVAFIGSSGGELVDVSVGVWRFRLTVAGRPRATRGRRVGWSTDRVVCSTDNPYKL